MVKFHQKEYENFMSNFETISYETILSSHLKHDLLKNIEEIDLQINCFKKINKSNHYDAIIKELYAKKENIYN